MKKATLYLINIICIIALLFTCMITVSAEQDPRITAETDKTELSLGEEVTVTVKIHDFDMYGTGVNMLEIHLPLDTTYLQYVQGSETSFANAGPNQILTIGFAPKSETFKYALVDVTTPITVPADGSLFSFRMKMAGIPTDNTDVTLTPKIHILSVDEGDNLFTKTLSATITLKKQEVKPKKQYNVTFIYEKTGEIITVRTVSEGEAALYPWVKADEAPEIPGMTFSGWVGDASAVYTDLTVKARYSDNLYVVTFLGADGKILSSQQVKWKESAVAPEIPSITGYKFTGFSDTFDNITSSKTVKLLYEKENPTETATPTPSQAPTATPECSSVPTCTPTNSSAPTATPEDENPENSSLLTVIIVIMIAVIAVVSVLCIVLLILLLKKRKSR